MTTINVELNIQIPGGSQITSSTAMEVDAYDFIQATVKPSKTVNIDVQPAETTKVSLLAIKSSWYGADLKYGTSNADIQLDQPQLYLGAGVIKLGNDVKKLQFKNETTGDKAKDATVEILVGRKAVTEPAPPPPVPPNP